VNLRAVPAENRPPVPFDELTIRIAMERVDEQIRKNTETVCQKFAAGVDLDAARALAEATLELLRTRRQLALIHAEKVTGLE